MIKKLFPKEHESLGLDLSPGAHHYRSYVGYPKNYDLIAAMTFGLLTTIGLRQDHKIVDIGCGSLRIGRLLIPYLNVANYIGIEPNRWLVEEGIARELGKDLVRIKRPKFYFTDSPKILTKHGSLLNFALAQSIFSHCGLDLISSWLASVSSVLVEQGALLATFIHGNEDFTGTGWCYPECVTYKQATIEKIACDTGFRFELLDWKHPHQSWALFAKTGFDSSWFKDKPLTWNTRFDAQRT